MRERTPVSSLTIGLSGWIIQDSNSADISRGDRLAFALEFSNVLDLEYLAPVGHRIPTLSSGGDNAYDIVGQVIHVTEDWWAIDVGIRVFEEGPPPAWARVGQWLTGKVLIGIDPFFYFETLAFQAGAPALIYDWAIENIELSVTLSESAKERREIRKSPEAAWKKILKTDVWNDGGPIPEYLLTCSLISQVPRHAR